MQPVKNGRADMPATSSGAGSPSESQPSDMQALQQAGYLAQLTDAAEGMGEGGELGASSSSGMDAAAAASAAASDGETEAPGAADDKA